MARRPMRTPKGTTTSAKMPKSPRLGWSQAGTRNNVLEVWGPDSSGACPRTESADHQGGSTHPAGVVDHGPCFDQRRIGGRGAGCLQSRVTQEGAVEQRPSLRVARPTSSLVLLVTDASPISASSTGSTRRGDGFALVPRRWPRSIGLEGGRPAAVGTLQQPQSLNPSIDDGGGASQP